MSHPFTLPLGSPAPEFRLPSTEGDTVSLDSFAGSHFLVVFFTCVHCPYVTGSDEHTRQVVEKYRPRGVEFVAINSNSARTYPSDSLEGMKERMEREGLPWKFLKDESQEVAVRYGALRTPHFFVFDQGRRLVYCGRSLDKPRNWKEATQFDLINALEDLLAGRPVATPLTNPIGCNVKWEGKESGWMPPEACDLV
jgi:peroxiredoxin